MKKRYTTYANEEILEAYKALSEHSGLPVSTLIGMASDDFLLPLGWIDTRMETPHDRSFFVKKGVPSRDVQYLGSSGSASIVDLGKGTARIVISLHGATTEPYTLPEGMKYVNVRSVSPTGITIGMGASRECEEREQFLKWETEEEG